MKITIQLGENSNYSMNLSEEKAIEIYADLISYLLKKTSEPLIINDAGKISCSTTLVNVENATPVVKEKMDTMQIVNPFANNDHFNYKKLIAYRCPKCGEITIRYMTLQENNITHCHFCREENIAIKDIRIASYNCPKCGTSAYLWVANELKEIPCKECESIIDLFEDEKDGGLKSQDLLGKTYKKY
jgi:predicted RNA-binding Zn-ribbon protein involved in translation (DUF1610 family)